MGARIRARSWDGTPLGPVESWPRPLRTAVEIMLGARTRIGICWGDELIVLYNDAWRELIGHKHPQALGRPARDVFPEIWERMGPMFRDVLAGRGAVEARDRLLPLDRDGEVRKAWFDYSTNPIPLADGSVGGLFTIAVETTHRLRRRRLAAAVQASREAVILVDAGGRIESWNRGAEEIYGYDADAAIGMKMERLVPDEERPAFRRLLAEEVRGAGPRDIEGRRVTRDGRLLDVWSTVSATEEHGVRMLAFLERDVTRRKEADRHRELLVQELDHRVRNVLTTVESIFRHSRARREGVPDEFAEAFLERIRSLAQAHHSLSREEWEGVRLRELAERILGPHGGQERIRIEGDDLLLPVRVTTPLAMALHELATNADKHGALSTPAGRVRLRWRVHPGGSLALEWKEEGGPAVAEPEETGFGMLLLERGVEYELHGHTELRYEEDGIRYVVEVPLDLDA